MSHHIGHLQSLLFTFDLGFSYRRTEGV